jgi:hypothetical protein
MCTGFVSGQYYARYRDMQEEKEMQFDKFDAAANRVLNTALETAQSCYRGELTTHAGICTTTCL